MAKTNKKYIMIAHGRKELDWSGTNLYKLTISRKLFDDFEEKIRSFGIVQKNIDFDKLPKISEDDEGVWEFVSNNEIFNYNEETQEDEIIDESIIDLDITANWVSFYWIGGIGTAVNYAMFGARGEEISLYTDDDVKNSLFRE